MYMTDFVHLPADGDIPAKWLNLSMLLEIEESADGKLYLWLPSTAAPFEVITGQQAVVLRRHLSGRNLSDRTVFSDLESRLEARGVVR